MPAFSERPRISPSVGELARALAMDSPGNGSMCAVPEKRGALARDSCRGEVVAISGGKKYSDCDGVSGFASAVVAEGWAGDDSTCCSAAGSSLSGGPAIASVSGGADGPRPRYFASDSPGKIIGS